MNENTHWVRAARRLGQLITDEEMSLPAEELQKILSTKESGQQFAKMNLRTFQEIHAQLVDIREANDQ